MKTITSLGITLLALGSIVEKSDAATFILDSTNNYSVTIDSSFTISQPNYTAGVISNGAITFSGATAALGLSDVADFSANTFTQIGSGSQPGGNRPQDFASNAIDFTIQNSSNNLLYNAQITYFAPPNGNTPTGTPPTVNNAAGLVINVTAAPVPEPSSTILLGLATASLTLRRSRKAQ